MPVGSIMLLKEEILTDLCAQEPSWLFPVDKISTAANVQAWDLACEKDVI